MSTKVKGEAIKEGSIPLSALAEDVKEEFSIKYGLSGYIGKLTTDNTRIESSTSRLFLYIKDKIYNTALYTSISLTQGPPVDIQITSLGYKTIVSITSGAEHISYYGNIKVFTKHIEVPNITPDYNAKEGEPGFIKNKPFRFVDAYGAEYAFTNPLKEEDFEAVQNEYGEVLKYRKPINADNIQYVVCNKKLSYDGELFTTAFYPIDRVDGKYFIGIGEHSAYIYIEEGDWDNGDTNNWLIVEVDYDRAFLPANSVFVIDDAGDQVDYITPSIPNVVKTTPQTLSNNDKNQALSNLGIDPVVWKYMCNPYHIVINYFGEENAEDWLISTEISDPDLLTVLTNNPEIGRLLIVANNDGDYYPISRYYDGTIYDFNVEGVYLGININKDGTIDKL